MPLASSMMHQHQNKCIKCLTDQVNSVKIKIKISLKRQMRKEFFRCSLIPDSQQKLITKKLVNSDQFFQPNKVQTWNS